MRTPDRALAPRQGPSAPPDPWCPKCLYLWTLHRRIAGVLTCPDETTAVQRWGRP